PDGAVVTCQYVAGIVPTAGGAAPNETYTMVATHRPTGVNAKLVNKTVTFNYDVGDGSWKCTSNLDDAVRPKTCEKTVAAP
ncbi:MAG: pilin, partial [Burkholderiales bacterium]